MESVAVEQETDARCPQLALELPARLRDQGSRVSSSSSKARAAGARQGATHRYQRSMASNGNHCPACPPGRGCAKPATALNKFLPTSCASRTGSGAVELPARTTAVEVAGLAATAAADWPRAASCASTDSSGSQRIPSVAVDEVDAAGLPKVVEEKEGAEGMNVLRRRKMEDGFVFVRLREQEIRSAPTLTLLRLSP